MQNTNKNNNNINYYYYNNTSINNNSNSNNNNNNNSNQNVINNSMMQQQMQQQHIRVSNWVQDNTRNQYQQQIVTSQPQQQQLSPCTQQQQTQFHNYTTQQQQQPQQTATTTISLPSMNYYTNHNHHLLQQQTHATCVQQQTQQVQQQTLKLMQQQQHPQQILTPAPSPVTTSNVIRQHQQQSQQRLTQQQQLLVQQHHHQQHLRRLVSMECMQTGVPTLTTPTLTPTTLKSIEESFIQLTSEPINAPYQAGFIPPPLGSYNSITSNTTNNNTINNNNNNNSTIASVTTTVAGVSPNTTMNNVFLGDISTGASLHDYANLNESDTENSQGSWNDNHLNEENSMATSDNSSGATDTTSFQNGLSGMGVNTLNNSNSSTTNDFSGVNLTAIAVATAAAKMSGCGNNNTSASATTVTPRRGGGRRPATNSNMSPEEEEKRRIRRERNKLAAARCRKRRVDQTNELTDEVQLLEKKREELQKQIESLNGTKQNLEFLLEAHRPTCQRLENADILLVNTFSGLMPSSTTSTTTNANDNITGLDTSLATTARSISPLDLKPVLNDHLLAQIKSEPLDATLDSNSSLDQDGPTSPKRLLMHNNNPMIPPPLPNVATLSASLAAASASLNTPIQTTAPVSFASMYSNNPTLNAPLTKHNSKQRPNSLPTVPRNSAQSLALGVNDNKPPTDINGVAIQTPSTGMFNFDSLMDGGTGLTPVSGPLVPNCSSQNKHPLELVTPTSEPSKLVSL